MIPKQEVIALAKAKNIEPRIIEKDYILGWLLAGINHHPLLKNKWIFKGGTCLKKCYFHDYRFSEDLDFTVLDISHLDNDFLQNIFLELLKWTYEKSGIEFAFDKTKFDIHPNLEKQYITGSVYYTGPLQQRGTLNKVFLDILGKEILVLPSIKLPIYHPYSDKTDIDFDSDCYSLEEIFAEKIRALSERVRPRDLYDVIYLYRNKASHLNYNIFMEVLFKKFLFKNLSIPKMEDIENHNKFIEMHAEWKNMLKHQVSQLPDIAEFLTELNLFFHWLEEKILKKDKI